MRCCSGRLLVVGVIIVVIVVIVIVIIIVTGVVVGSIVIVRVSTMLWLLWLLRLLVTIEVVLEVRQRALTRVAGYMVDWWKMGAVRRMDLRHVGSRGIRRLWRL